MKIHFGEIENYGDYESPLYGCEQTICGYTGEEPTENAVNVWGDVTCKKCLKLKDSYIESCKIDEEAIVNQMGDMADFMMENN